MKVPNVLDWALGWSRRPTLALPAGGSAGPPAGPLPTTDPDRPIENEADDRFGRAPFAKAVARYVANTPPAQSVVFALTGAWGAGKTSVLNMVGRTLEAQGIAVLRFNPWLFSGTEQIATQFMRELSAQLGTKDRDLKEIGASMEAYGAFLEAVPLPVVSPLGKAMQGLGKVAASRHQGSVNDARERVEALLKTKARRVVVFVDDIDRLDADEVRQVFKLVRLVADFPNVSYVLAYDRRRVEKCLGADDVTGREYLAKIVQSSFDLPVLEPEILRAHLIADLDACLEGREFASFHQDDWGDLLMGVIVPLIKTPRDVRRYINAVAPAVDMLGDEVALEDLLALEAVRLFVPDLFDALPSIADLITLGSTVESGFVRHRLGPEEKKRVQEFVATSPGHRKVAEELCEHAFPASRFALDGMNFGASSATAWRRDRRVAHRDVLDIYMRRKVPATGIPARAIDEIVSAFGDEKATRSALAVLEPGKLEATLVRLEDHAPVLAKGAFENGMVAVLREADRLRRDREGFFDLGADLAVSRLLYWILRNVPELDRRRAAVDSVLARTSSLTWKAFVVNSLAPHEKEGLIDSATVGRWYAEFERAVQATSDEQLCRERDLLRVLLTADRDPVTMKYRQTLLARLGNPQVMRALLASGLGQAMSNTIGSAVTHIVWQMPWAALRSLAGDEARLTALVSAAIRDWVPGRDPREKEALRNSRDLLDGKVAIPPSEAAAPAATSDATSAGDPAASDGEASADEPGEPDVEGEG